MADTKASEYVTVDLDDGRSLDVFRSGAIQVYTAGSRHGWEFRLPDMPHVTGTPLTITVHRIG